MSFENRITAKVAEQMANLTETEKESILRTFLESQIVESEIDTWLQYEADEFDPDLNRYQPKVLG